MHLNLSRKAFATYLITLIVFSCAAANIYSEKLTVVLPKFVVKGRHDRKCLDKYHNVLREALSEKFIVVEDARADCPEIVIHISSFSESIFWLSVKGENIEIGRSGCLDLSKDLTSVFSSLGESIVEILSFVPDSIEGSHASKGEISVKAIPANFAMYIDGNYISDPDEVINLDLNTKYDLTLFCLGYETVREKILLTEDEPVCTKKYVLKKLSDAVIYIRPPLLSRRELPVYPVSSRSLGEEGTVILVLALDEIGEVTTVYLLESSGYDDLDAAAVESAYECEFEPAMIDGIAIGGIDVELTYRFVLEKNYEIY